MEKIDGYWTDENNNRWDASIWTEQDAEKASASLINCWGCTDCRLCTRCTRCTDCTGCTDCTDCTDCKRCTDCRLCHGFMENPNRYAFNKCGGGYNNTGAYWIPGDKNVQVVCGCFHGDLMEFENAVTKKYGNTHEYHGAIEIIRTILAMETKPIKPIKTKPIK